MLLCSRSSIVTPRGCQPITREIPLAQTQPKQIVVLHSEQKEMEVPGWNARRKPLQFECPKPDRFEPSRFCRPRCGTPVKTNFDFSDEDDDADKTSDEGDDDDDSEDESNWFLYRHERPEQDSVQEELFELQC